MTPPVEAATPASLGGTANRIKHVPDAGGSALTAGDFTSRFFSGMGPTDIFEILALIDGHITEINEQSKSATATCVTQVPVAYNLTPFGQTVPFYGNCVETFDDPNGGFVQYGQNENDTYIYVYGSVGVLAAKLHALPAVAADSMDGSGATQPGAEISTNYVVEAWLTVGLNNAASCGNMTGFDDCSYAAIHLLANSSTKTFEMAVAGINVGFCGAQIQSDGTTVYGIGSSDMGMTCNDTETLCVSAADLTTAGTCGASLTTFALPAIGREASVGTSQSFGASAYPGGDADTIVLNGTATDSLNFGPSTPTTGVGTL